MIGHLYRYPHPSIEGKWLYVGQGVKRDNDHRAGRTSFGRRFKRDFPGIELPQPIKEAVQVTDQLELNEKETIWMFRFRTWWGYEGGMNISIPASQDYKEAARLAGREAVRSGHMEKMRLLPQTKEAQRKNGLLQAKKLIENGTLAKCRTPEHQKLAGLKGGQACKNSGQIQTLGRSQGRKNAENGLLNQIRNLPQSKEAFKKNGIRLGNMYGKINGYKNSESGHCARISELGTHVQHHLNRDKPNPRCALCSEQSLIIAYA